MPKVKNISGGELEVPFLDRIVEDGEIVDAPDFQADGVSPLVWPPNRWEPVTAKAAKAAAKADKADAAASASDSAPPGDSAGTAADDTSGKAM